MPSTRMKLDVSAKTSTTLLGALTACLIATLVSACGGGSAPGGPDAAPPSSGFGIDVSPASAVAFADSRRMLTVTLTRAAGFTDDVTVALSNPPPGVAAQTLTFTGNVASLPVSVALDAGVAPGNLALAFTASGGGSSADTVALLRVQAAQPRAQQKIADALAAHSIDRDTSLLYRLYALAGDPRLPDAYVGSGSDQEDFTLYEEAGAALAQMSPALQTALHPFMVRPDHPDSVYRRPGTTSSRSGALSAARGQAQTSAVPPSATCAVGAQWRSVRSATIPVRVWSECYADAGAAERARAGAADTMAVFEKIWAPMTALMGPIRLDGDKVVDATGNDVTDNGGDDAIDVYIVGSYSLTRDSQPVNTAAVGDALGFSRPADPCIRNNAGNLICSGYFVLPASAAGTAFQRSTIIHELFHIFQYAHNAQLKLVNKWFYEASARWVESHFDRVLAWPQRVALSKVHRDWFKQFTEQDLPLDATSSNHPYAAYIWPFFVEQENNGPAIVGRIWTALESAKTLADEDRAIDSAYGFDVNFHRFAVRNVNEELLPGNPVRKRYIDLAGVSELGVKQFPDGTVTPKYLSSTLVKDSVDTRAYLLGSLSAEYAKFVVDKAAPPSRVEFDFSGLSNRSGLKLDALIRTTTPTGADEWVSEPVPLDPEGKAVFCFLAGPSTTTVRGAFTELRLVLSNSSLDKFVTGNVVARPTGKACGIWEGTIEYSQEFDEVHLGGHSHFTATATTQLAFELDETAVDLRNVFRMRSGSFVYRQVQDSEDVGNACHDVTTASGPLHQQTGLADTSDGAADGTLYTYVGAFGTPVYDIRNELGSQAVYAYATTTTASQCTRGTSTRTASGVLMELWQKAGPAGDITEGGTVMQGTYSFPSGAGTISYRWLLTKKFE